MYLDQRGFVRACCVNDFHLLGNVTERPLVEIWRGEQAQILRRAMERHDLELGCDFCQWQVDAGRPELAFSRWYRDHQPADADPLWPRQLELALSNTCNLQCVMCDGEWSSSIRSQREGKAPLPAVYTDAFFDELADFLPHLQRVKFLGGEPFLAGETLRVMEMIVDTGLQTRCHVTTNGTHWTPRVEHILDMCPIDIAVSLDGATAETHERIRVGSSWSVVQANLDRFQEHAAARDTDVTVTYCLMTENWRELAAFCRLSDARGIDCAVNTVTHPLRLSPYQLPVPQLEEIVTELGREDPAQFTRSRPTWEGELAKLRAHLDDRREGRTIARIDTWRENPVFVRPHQGENDHGEQAQRRAVADGASVTPDDDHRSLREETVGVDAPCLRLDADGIVTGGSDDRVLGLLPAALGCRGAELPDVVSACLAAVEEILPQRDEVGGSLHRVRLADGRELVVLACPEADDQGRPTGSSVYFTWA